jgi:Domain of unknown function (DUF5076)
MTSRELTPPPRAYALTSEELVRVWFANGRLNVVTGTLESAAYVGLMLADLSRHAARVFADQTDLSPAGALAAIRAKFDEMRTQLDENANTDMSGIYPSKPEMKFRQLTVPPAILTDPEAAEVIRIWRSTDNIDMVLHGIWDAPDNWGILLNDLCRLLARPEPTDMSAAAIRTWLIREWDRPTDEGMTGVLKTH